MACTPASFVAGSYRGTRYLFFAEQSFIMLQYMEYTINHHQRTVQATSFNETHLRT
jgi:hypothetical protein